MKIVFLLTQSLESPGGGGRYLPLAKALLRLGHQVTMIALHHDYARTEQRRFTLDGVEVWYVGQMHVHKSGNRKTYYPWWMLLWITAVSTVRLTWAAWRTPADVLHVCKTQPMNGLAAWIVHRLRGTPVYLDSDDYEAVNNRFAGAWQQRIVAWFEDWMPSFAAGITVGTTFIADRFKALGYPANQIVLVHNGVDRQRFALLRQHDLPARLEQLRCSLPINKQARVVLYVGSMSLISHAVDLLLEAFVSVVREEPNAHLLLVGAGEDLEFLQRLSQDLGIANHVYFVGRISLEQVPLYYQLSDLTVDPRRDAIPDESSLSLKLFESIAAGVPCVTADIGDRRAVAGNAGLAVQPGDSHALAEGILTILQNVDLAHQMHLSAMSLRESYWWDVRANAFASLYPQRPQ